MSCVVTVGLGDRSYAVTIGSGLVGEAGARIAALGKKGRLAVVGEEAVLALHGARLFASLKDAGFDARKVVIPGGETAKSFASLERLCDDLLAIGLDRGEAVVALGGGVTGDLAGFAAAITKRGLDLVQIPTTLLAQVDSSVGGKTAIDTPRGKNLVGAFHQPRLVLADLDALATLPAREMACGYAEIVKIALVGDAAFFAWLEGDGAKVLARVPDALSRAVRRAVEMKAAIVEADERDGGMRALLNLGHTFAHAIEAETGYGEAVKHGEAVGLGCAMAVRFSERGGLCPAADARRAEAAIAAAGLPTRLADVPGGPFDPDALIAHMRQDKKARSGGITLILARRIGAAFVAQDVDEGEVRRFLAAEGASA